MSNSTVSPLMQTRPTQALEWFVLVETGSLAGRRFPLTSNAGSLTLGREGDCTIRFDPNQERMVGRHHARIEIRADGVYLVDTNSANGTFKNGAAVSEVRLQHGDRFQLGGEVDDIQGPWVSIHLPVAVHMAPMATDAKTVIIRPGTPAPAPAPQAATHQQPTFASTFNPAVISQESWTPPVTPHEPWVPPATQTPPVQPYVPPVQQYTPPGQQYAPLPDPPERMAPPESVREQPAVVAEDPLHRQRRAYLLRQVAAIVTLLLLACGIGVAFGLHENADPDAESAGRP